ncbi:hypothetical protein [Streptomyces sp. NBC_01233]|uniref:hypothetical protein n=1 Tax=Streptomyces sp. NBC_01233 TaxID=2903787 RepID=UPI002E161FFE
MARPDGVRHPADGEFGGVPVQVQLPQARQPEYVERAGDPVQPDPDAHDGGRFVERDGGRHPGPEPVVVIRHRAGRLS